MTARIVATLRDRIAEALNHRIGTSPEEIEHRARLAADYSRALASLTGPVEAVTPTAEPDAWGTPLWSYARAFAEQWLRAELRIEPGEDVPEIDFTEEADGSWAFSIKTSELPDGCEDTTSYIRIVNGEVQVQWEGTSRERPVRETVRVSIDSFVDTSTAATEAYIERMISEGSPFDTVIAEDLRAGDVLVHDGRTMVVERVEAYASKPSQHPCVQVFERGAGGLRGPAFKEGQTVRILRRPEAAKTVGATIPVRVSDEPPAPGRSGSATTSTSDERSRLTSSGRCEVARERDIVAGAAARAPSKQDLFARAFDHCLAGERRVGQALFVALTELMPDLAEEIRGTPNDPFHASGPDDPRLAGALELIERRIKSKTGRLLDGVGRVPGDIQ